MECGMEFRRRGIDPDSIEAVEIGVNGQAHRSTGTPLPRRYTPQTDVDAQFSIPYSFATAMRTGAVTVADFQPPALVRPEILALAAKVSVGIDPEIERSHGRELSPARATLRLRDGSNATAVVMEPLGAEARPVPRTMLLEKFRGCCRSAGWTEAETADLTDCVLAGGEGAAARLYPLLRRASAMN
jgi:2-methylcitrate dehydratase PrpD